MLRKFWVLPLLSLLALPAISSAQFEKGDWELTLTGSGMTSKDAGNTAIGVTGGVGYFLYKELEVGVRQNVSYVSLRDTSDGTKWGGSTFAFVDYNFDMGKLVPFIGANVGYLYGADQTGSGAWGPEVGLKYFVNSTTFIYGVVAYEVPFSNPDNAGFLYSLGIGFRF